MEFKYTDDDIKKAAEEWISPIDELELITEETYIIDGEKVTLLDYADPYLDIGSWYSAGLYYDGVWTDGPEAVARQNVHQELPNWNPQKGDLNIDISDYDFDLQKDMVIVAGLELDNSLSDKVSMVEDPEGNEYLSNGIVAYDYKHKTFIKASDIPEED